VEPACAHEPPAVGSQRRAKACQVTGAGEGVAEAAQASATALAPMTTDCTQSTPPQSLPAGSAFVAVQEPSQPAGGSELVAAPPTAHVPAVAEIDVGRAHVPLDAPHVHRSHVAGTWSWPKPSYVFAGAAFGQAGALAGASPSQTSAGASQPLGAPSTQVPAQPPVLPPLEVDVDEPVAVDVEDPELEPPTEDVADVDPELELAAVEVDVEDPELESAVVVVVEEPDDELAAEDVKVVAPELEPAAVAAVAAPPVDVPAPLLPHAARRRSIHA